jgi:hypothetical protein
MTVRKLCSRPKKAHLRCANKAEIIGLWPRCVFSRESLSMVSNPGRYLNAVLLLQYDFSNNIYRYIERMLLK